MKCIIDIEALKKCLGLLNSPCTYKNDVLVKVVDVEALIDAFPKDEINNKCTN